MWLPSTSSGSISLDKSSLNLTCMELVYISFSNTNSWEERFRLTVQLCILYIGCEVQPCLQGLPGLGGSGISRCCRGQESPGCHPGAMQGYQPLWGFMGLKAIQSPAASGCSKGFPSHMGMLTWLWAEGDFGELVLCSGLEGAADPRAPGARPCSLCVCSAEMEL